MLDAVQKTVLHILAANRSPDSFVAGGSALNRDGPRLSRDIDLFQQTVAMIDAAIARDLPALIAAGFSLTRLRETATSREWLVTTQDGRATRLQWSRDTAWLFFPPVPDSEFGYALMFEDLAVNKMSAAADRGRRRDFHDLAALDAQGVPPWVLALAAMGKDADLSPPAVLERARRLLSQAGTDDEDPDYAGPGIPWPVVRRRMDRRLREDLAVLDGFRWTDWAGMLPLDRQTARLPLALSPDSLSRCARAHATPAGSWPTTLAAASEMLRGSAHPQMTGVVLDLASLLADDLRNAQ